MSEVGSRSPATVSGQSGGAARGRGRQRPTRHDRRGPSPGRRSRRWGFLGRALLADFTSASSLLVPVGKRLHAVLGRGCRLAH